MQDPFAYCAEFVRTADRDRFIAALFAPPQSRRALHALYAFNAEVARVREVAHTALPGEIRLQWWSEVLGGQRAEEARANPVAAALLATIERHSLSPARFIDLIEARRFDLYDEPMPTIGAFESYALTTSSALLTMAAQILGGGEVEAVTRPAGIGYALAGVLRAFPRHAARGRLYLPTELIERHRVRPYDLFAGRSSPALGAAFAELRDRGRRHMDVAHEHMRALPPQAVPALLPVALVRPTLARLERSDPFAATEIPPWRRQWLMWRAARNPARITG